jgi:3-hydroxyisobutyrate dehydrogenase
MARSLLRNNIDVTVWNRTRSRAEPLAADGARIADTAAEAVGAADIVITMLFDAEAVLDVIDEAASAFQPDAIWVQAATIGLAGTARVAALAQANALTVVDAPVVGTKEPAEQGTLVIVAGGDRSLLPRLTPVFDAIGSRTVWAGDALGEGTALKLACNAWIAAVTAATAQSLALASGLAVDPQLFLEVIAGGAADSPYAQLKGRAMLAGNFAPSFGLDGLRKDVDLIAEAAGRAGVDARLINALAAVYATASDLGHGGDDIAAVVNTFDAGLVGRHSL